jgi:hypothetical protein
MTVLTSYLKKVLVADAAVSGAAAVAMASGSGLVAGLLGLPSDLLLGAGLVLVPWVIALILIARRQSVPAGVIVAVIATNFAWAAASLVVAFGPMFAVTLLGKVFVVAQAATVALFAELQIMGLRRTRAAG